MVSRKDLIERFVSKRREFERSLDKNVINYFI